MDSHEVLKTYAMFYVSENDEFTAKKKLELLNIIEGADEKALADLFEKGEIEAPLGLLEDEKSSVTLIGESAILCQQAAWLMEGDVILELDLKNRLKDALGMQTDLKYKITKAAGSAKKALEKQLDAIGDTISNLKDSIASGAAKAGEKIGDVAQAGADVVEKGAKKAVVAGAKAAEKVSDTAKEHLGSAGDAIEKGAKYATVKAAKGAEKIAGAAQTAADFAKDQPGMVGGAVAAAAALTAGVMAYRKFFSKAAQACKSAPDKNACMGQYKMKAKQAQISALAAGKAKCAKTKNPQACSGKIDAKIAGLKAKMRG